MPTEAEAAPLEALETVVGRAFHDRRLLLTAVTHRSYLNEVEVPDSEDNERLEFLGDALVDFVAGDYLYRTLPAAREGELTALRSALVCESALATFARALDLGAYLRLGRGEAASGGRTRPAILCNTFEALVGALYLDGGFGAAEALVMAFFRAELPEVIAEQRMTDAKSRFQELAQRTWQITPHYRTVSESGPDHAKHFVVTVVLGEETWGVGEGSSKAIGARQAALHALARFEAQQPEASGV
jgi:ribonuclease III